MHFTRLSDATFIYIGLICTLLILAIIGIFFKYIALIHVNDWYPILKENTNNCQYKQ